MKKLITVAIQTEYIKLDSLIKLSGLTQTGGQAKEIIEQGSVFFKNEVVYERGKKIRPGESIRIDEIIIEVITGDN